MVSEGTLSPRTRAWSAAFWCWLVRSLLFAGLLLLAGCGDGQATGGVEVLAKTGIGREEADGPLGDPMEAGLRVAVGRAAADTLWDALEADELDAASDPAERGRHGQLGDVDFDTQAVVLWRGGESGSCPERLDGLATQDDGVVEVTLSRSLLDVACTDDYRPYAVLAAVDRQALPEALPARGRALGPGDQHTTFPVVDADAPDAGADTSAAPRLLPSCSPSLHPSQLSVFGQRIGALSPHGLVTGRPAALAHDHPGKLQREADEQQDKAEVRHTPAGASAPISLLLRRRAFKE